MAVWDVRSTKPLKVFSTDKKRGTSRVGGSTTWLSEDPQEWNHWKSRGPGWSARVVKFGGRPGRELMLFTEHTSLIHVVDARTFETEEILHMPAFPAPLPRTRSGPAAAAAGSLRTARIVRTLEETFRITASGGDGDDMLVIPPFGDREVEREVRRVLRQHGVQSRLRIANTAPDDEMDDVQGQAPAAEGEPEILPALLPLREDEDANPEVERNLAGACFDPSGAYVYAASDGGVAEWGVRGAEKRWWVDGAWER